MNMRNWFNYNLKYAFKCWIYLPITFVKRVLLGRDPVYKRFFWDKWGFLPGDISRLTKTKKILWIIANSGGEVIQSVSFLRKLKKKMPDYHIVVSTESYDTFKYASGLDGVDFVLFAPWDIPFCVKRVLKKVQPSALVFIEHCYFPILAKIANRLDVKTLLCSGIIGPKLFKGNFLLKRAFILRFYEFLDRFSLKTDEDYTNLLNLGVKKEKISVLGNMKFDLQDFILDENQKTALKKELSLVDEEPVFLVGSLHQGEVDLILESFSSIRRSYPNLKLILAPRWNRDIAFIRERIANTYLYRLHSEFKDKADRYDILIIDTFGKLPYLYGIASVSFIAASIVPINLRCLGHNIFEPLAHGVPIIFGPHMELWRQITKSMKEVWLDCEVKDAQALSNSVREVLSNKDLAERLKVLYMNLNKSNQGIVDRNIVFIQSLVN